MEFINEFEALYKEYYSRMYFFSLTIVGEEETARDIVGDVFSKVWDDYDLFDHRNMKSYLMTSVRNRSIDHIRRIRRMGATTEISQLVHGLEAIQWDEDREQKLQQLESSIKQLPELTQQVLKLCYFKHMKQAEAAEELNITPKMVKRHISNALSKLREINRVQK